jgi:hypothetical protein
MVTVLNTLLSADNLAFQALSEDIYRSHHILAQSYKLFGMEMYPLKSKGQGPIRSKIVMNDNHIKRSKYVHIFWM